MAEELRDFLVPDLGEGLEEATVVEWHVAPGDTVALNQVLCTVETAKAEVEVPSPYAGAVVALGGAANETLKVGSLLARIALSTADAPEGTAAAPAASGTREPTLVGYGHDESIDRSRRRRRGSAPSPEAPVASADPTVATDPVTAVATVGDTPPGVASGATAGVGRALAAPPVRKLARDLGVDLQSLAPGRGPDGIVTRADVRAAADTPAPGGVVASIAGSDSAGTTVVPVTGVRARVAEHMSTSRTRIPDATCSVTVDCTRLLEVRAALNSAADRRGLGTPVTPFSLLCRLFVQALVAVPGLNASYDESGPAIRYHSAVHLGIGTATDRGLLVTVVRDADGRSTLDLSSEIARLSAAARDHTITPGELTGSTITVSNFGALGLDEGIPVINHPEAAILGVGSIKPRPYVVDGVVVARPTSTLTLAFDHRVGDGADAGGLLSRLRDLVEAPELALLDA
jgi:pyruvate dehydrogenase E2 component (dihydrolipoamide acetyltransferase)